MIKIINFAVDDTFHNLYKSRKNIIEIWNMSERMLNNTPIEELMEWYVNNSEGLLSGDKNYFKNLIEEKSCV